MIPACTPRHVHVGAALAASIDCESFVACAVHPIGGAWSKYGKCQLRAVRCLDLACRPVAAALACMLSECRVVWPTIDTPSNSMPWQSNVRVSHLLAHFCACGFRRAHTVRLSITQVAGRPFGLVPSRLFEGRKRRTVPLTRTFVVPNWRIR